MTTHVEALAPSAAATADPQHWPDVARVPRTPLKATVARRLLRRIARRRGLRVELPNGRLLEPAPAGAPVLRLHRPDAFFHRVGMSGLIGFGESYQAGEWDSPDLVGLLTELATAPETLVPTGAQWLRRLYVKRPPAGELSTPDNARTNIHRHYDLSNELFALFLDPTLSYSSAVFATDPAGAPLASSENLAQAQHRKIDRLLDLAGVGAGSRVLEIGTGWGELAVRAAARGARVVSLTLSEEQLALARRRIAAAGFTDRVEVRLCDYRAAEGEFDAVVSVEMVEAVGRPFWPAYFATIDRVLAPGGRVALQAITMPHERMLASSGTYTWILKYIFPGGQIPSTEAIRQATARHTGLRVAACDSFGPHYAQTLRLWRERFTERADEIAALGFDQVFQRMWELYLAYSEAGFAAGYLDVQQILLTRPEPTR
ncbi:class I SAM-dependent methyltransferase [Streptomyces rubellomurinus]|uniref:Cyclopropane-fatty-acyl-phospholipid synthase n=1 Tax=Streptomyces rubellomurinus (strain ATCC 31215) TaxID=359131 RepID=A0A0F2TE83_STRR3|nr:class I SAM-dependent methyltransferase [Streptomyces rubellomurinus]KJS61449.1 cyclopropane-fatty-acyl-phospholipid synthase [Streptomyces rubellomurinus]